MNQAHINKLIGQEFLSLEELLGWSCGVVLNQLLVRRTRQGWQTIIKGRKRGKNVVAYIEVDSFSDGVELAGEFASRGCLDWRPDKYPPKNLG